MAKNPQKVKDATEEALTAIQEALNVRDASAPPPSAPVEPRIEPRPEPLPEQRMEPRSEPRVETPAAAPPDLFHQEPESSGWAETVTVSRPRVIVHMRCVPWRWSAPAVHTAV